MALDNKYGKVTLEHGTIGDEEPIVVFRAKDELLVPLLEIYRTLCGYAGSPYRHLDAIDVAMQKIHEWQMDNATQIPQSATIDGGTTDA